MRTRLLKKLHKEAYDKFKIVQIEGKFQCYEWSCKFYRYEWNLMIKQYPSTPALFDTFQEAQEYLNQAKEKWLCLKLDNLRRERNKQLVQTTRVD
jgi:hypothetical protein